MPDKEALQQFLERKQQEFRDAVDNNDIDALYEINQDISDTMLMLYDAE